MRSILQGLYLNLDIYIDLIGHNLVSICLSEQVWASGTQDSMGENEVV